MQINRKIERPKGIVCVFAAVEGFGKTTTLAKLNGAYMLDTDDGSYGLDTARIEWDGTVNGMLGIIRELKDGKAPEDMKVLCIDTADKFCELLCADCCRRNKWENMEHFDYGKCWSIFKPEWNRIWDGLKDVARTRGISIFTSVHIDGNKTFTDSVTAKQWNRISMRLTPKCGSTLLEISDLYVTGYYDAEVYEEKKGMKKMEIAGTEKRVCCCEHSSKFDGKCRGFIVTGEGKPFPKKTTLDEFQKIITSAIAASTAQDENAPVAEPATPPPPPPPPVKENAKKEDPPKPDTSFDTEEMEAYANNPDYRQLKDLIVQFNVDENKLRAYVSTKATFGPNPPAWWKCNSKALQWLCKGLANEVIQPKLV